MDESQIIKLIFFNIETQAAKWKQKLQIMLILLMQNNEKAKFNFCEFFLLIDGDLLKSNWQVFP